MTDSLKSRLEFSSPVIQAQAVRSLVVAVLKEKGPNDQIIQSSTQSPAWESLWQQCCSDCAHVRSVCCDAVVLLVEQGHADLQNILNSVLNLLPSASNLQGLLKIIGRLLQMQADQREKEANFTCPYSIRNSPHPYITALENRMDCWPALLLEIDGFIQLAVERNKASYITMLAPFLRYLYCEPQQLPQHALLRQSLLRVLLPTQPTPGSAPQDRDQDQASAVHDSLLLCLCQLVPHMQLDRVEAALELSVFADALLQKLTRASGEFWIRERTSLLLQLLCACQRCLKLNTDCRPLLDLIQQLLPICQQDLPLDELLMSSALLLLEAPAAQQSRLLSLVAETNGSRTCGSGLFNFPCPPQPGPGLTLPLSPWYSELSVALSVLRRVARDPAAAADWLLAVSSALSCSQQLPSSCTLIVTHLIIAGDEDVCQLALKACQAIASVDPCQLCVPMVLQTLQMLASAPKLKAVVMRLMTALWKKQDRVYPELQRLLSQQDSRVVVGKDSEWERVLARAACLRDVCRERPYQHAADMLAGISLTLKQCSKPDMATPAALALQGLRELCQAEVVDIMSTWKSLGPELCCDSRPLMVKAIAELLSLVPQLLVKSDDYEKLKDEVVSFLWNYASKQDVAACGYKALAAFPEGVHTVLHLPEKARPAVKILENEEDSDENTEEEEEKDLSIPGSSYMKLLALTSSSVLSAFELFLTSLVRQEMNQMPRGVYFSALRGGGLRSDQGKTVAGIPSFMLKTYEKNKQPGLKPGLAAGLLLSYELPVQTDREGKPMDRFLISRSRSYQQTLTALIHEEQRSAVRSHQNCHKVSLTCDQDLDSPVVQGNSILALSSLAAVVAKYENNLPADSGGGVGAGPEFVPTASWLTMVLDTLLSIISSSYKARGQVFPWFLHVLAYSVACVSVSSFCGGLVDASKAEETMNALRALTEESQQLKSELELSSQQQSRLNEVIRAFTQVVSCSGAIGLQSNTACLLGHLHLAHVSTRHSNTAVPQDFSYLSEKSLIRSITDFIIEAGKKGPEEFPPVLATDFLFQLFAAAVVCWADHLMPLLSGRQDPVVSMATRPQTSTVDARLPLLLNKEPWSGQTHKFIDWLLSISDGPEHSLSAVTIRTAKAALLALKSSAEFRKKAVWTRAYGW
ncbi:Focadhesin [Oryzias melastigma]|uniref:Focadhesin n=1 Tax=Oryzias melastigma TaxID=30732 RepID=A0A834CN94_ORYME|nr:Focadhesin [Oryzias melastigma]